MMHATFNFETNAKYSSLESKCGAVHALMGDSNFAVIQCCNTYSSFICVSIRVTESKIIEKWKYRNGKVMSNVDMKRKHSTL